MDILLTAAIISFLSSVFLFNVSEAKKKAEDGRMKVETQQVSTAVTMYKEDNQNKAPRPSNITAGPLKYTEGQVEYEESMQVLVDGGYLSQIPRSPSGTSYVYAVAEDLENSFFMAKLNRSGGDSSHNSCPAVPPSEGSTAQYPSGYSSYSFGTYCDLVGFCDVGQVTDTSSCFAATYNSVLNYCVTGVGGPAVKPEYQGVYPVGICYRHVLPCESSPPPLPPPEEGYSMYFKLLPRVQAQTSCPPPMYFSDTKYYMCSHSSVPAEAVEDTNVCDGNDPSDYCQCI